MSRDYFFALNWRESKIKTLDIEHATMHRELKCFVYILIKETFANSQNREKIFRESSKSREKLSRILKIARKTFVNPQNCEKNFRDFVFYICFFNFCANKNV